MEQGGGLPAQSPRLRVVAAVALGAMLLTLVPYLLGVWWTPKNHEFVWTRVVNSADLPTNLAMIERVRAGELLIENSYSVEEPRYGVFRPAYLAIGLVARVTGLSAIGAFQLGRLVFGALLIVAVYRLSGLFLEAGRERILATVLVCLGSGVSWIGALLTGHALPWPDSWQSEATVFGVLMESPHFCFGLWLMLELVLQLDAALRAHGWGARHLALAALALFLGLSEQPYNGPLCGVLTIGLLADASARGVPLHRLAAAGGVALAAASIPAIWLLALIRLDPAMASWSQHNVLPSPPLVAYLLAFAPLWVLSVVGLSKGWRELADRRWLLLLWLLAPAVLLALPVSFQRRMAEGWIVPLGVLAAVGAARLRVPLLGPRAAAAALVAFACLGSVYLLSLDLALYRRAGATTHVPAPVMDGLRYVASRAKLDDIVVAPRYLSIWAPAVAPVRVFHGHSIQGIAQPDTVEGLVASLRAAESAREAPRFEAPFETTRFVLFLRRGPKGPLLTVGDYSASPWWSPAAFRNSAVVVYDLAQ